MIITPATKVLALIGDPVSHSLSPLMHNGWIADHGIDAVYVALRLRADDPAAAIRALSCFGLQGANVTTPHKQAAARAAAASEDSVANTLHWNSDGSTSAYNTDGAGFLDALTEAAPDWRARVRRVLVLGAGGAAQAIAAALSPHVQELMFVNRTAARAEAVAAGLTNACAGAWESMAAAFAHADLIVQATTMGMRDAPSVDWPVAECAASTIICDIVYNPLETALLRSARARGLQTMDGLGMLIHQGARAFEIWFGIKPDPQRARARLTAALSP
jgi:shikimate dehydrogenase